MTVSRDAEGEGENAPERDRAEVTRTAILDAAHALFVEHGPDGTSVRDIARAAGVTKSLIHHHFGTKEALYDAVCGRAFVAYWSQQRALFEAREGADEALLRESMWTFFRFHADNPDFVRLSAHHLVRSITGESDGSFTAVDETDLGQQLVLQGVDRLREAMRGGLLRTDLDPQWLLVVLLTATKAWFMVRNEWRPLFPHLDDAAYDAAYFDHMFGFFVEGIRPDVG